MSQEKEMLVGWFLGIFYLLRCADRVCESLLLYTGCCYLDQRVLCLLRNRMPRVEMIVTKLKESLVRVLKGSRLGTVFKIPNISRSCCDEIFIVEVSKGLYMAV